MLKLQSIILLEMRRKNNKVVPSIQISDSESEQSKEQGVPLKRRKLDSNGDAFVIRFQSDKQNKKVQQGKVEVTKQMMRPWMEPNTSSIKDSLLRLHNQVIDFYNYVKPSHKEHNWRLSAFQNIKHLVQEMFPEADVVAFGSFATQLYLPDGDIDIVVLTNNRYQVSEVYSKINKTLASDPLLYTQLQYIRKSKVPLIKFIYNFQGFPEIQFDISVDKPDGIYQVQYVKKMNKAYPQFKYLVFVFKCFLRIRGLAETYTGGIGSFLLFCMILFYLQDTHRHKKYYTLGEHVLNFMDFYGETDWSKKSVDVKSGTMKSRNRFDDNATFSCISPQDSSHDIGKAAFKIRDVFNVFKNRYRYIRGKIFEPGESILKELVNPRNECFKYYKKHWQPN